MENNYTVKPHRNGKPTVAYECARCHSPLESPLEEAGQTFACPACATTVQTPGVRELEEQREQRRAAIQAEQARAKAAAELAAAQKQQAKEARQAKTMALHISPLAFVLTLLVVVVSFYVAAVWPLQTKLRDLNGQLAETRERLDTENKQQAETQTKQQVESQPKKQVPDPPAIYKQVVVDQEPTMVDFRTFGEKFVLAWAEKNNEAEKKRTAEQSQHDNEANEWPSKSTCTIKATDKRKTDSLLHPVVWVLLADDYISNDHFLFSMGFSYTFCFTWDGKRWCGVDSTDRETYLQGIGDKKPDNIENVLSAETVDDVALKCQSP